MTFFVADRLMFIMFIGLVMIADRVLAVKRQESGRWWVDRGEYVEMGKV